jgi:predicted nucleic acid-binding protein
MFILDASTVILIAKIELLDIFLNEIGIVVAIPKAVEEECCGGKKTLDAFMIQKAVEQSRIKVKAVKSRKLATKLEADFSMARGESEAIALALQESALLVGIDDRQGTNACKLLGLPFTTAAAILLRSSEKGLIERSDAWNRLRTLARCGRYRSSILEDARRRLEENP